MTLREAVRAWRNGDPTLCVAACDEALAAGADLRLTRLKARALMRLHKSAEAYELITRAFPSDNASPEVAVLRAIAQLRTERHDEGLVSLKRFADGSHGASHQARANLALGIRYYELRQFDPARRALARISGASGVIYALALECLAWVEKADGDGIRSRTLFSDSLAALDRSGSRDLLLESNLLAIIGNLAVEAIDTSTFARLEGRYHDVSARGIVPWVAFWHAMNCSMAAELQGRASEALQHARTAARSAPSEAFALLAECRRAEVLYAYGELFGFRDLATQIYQTFERLEKHDLIKFEEINVILVVAETLAFLGEADRSQATFTSVSELSAEQINMLTDEPAKRAYFTATRALVDDVNGNTLRAKHGAKKAFDAYRSLGHKRRAAILALRIKTLLSESEIREYVEDAISDLPAGSWMRGVAAELSRTEGDLVLASLSRSEVDVLRMLCRGRSTAEIASARGRSVQTIRNTISALLHAFGVRTRAALISECARRGMDVGPAP